MTFFSDCTDDINTEVTADASWLCVIYDRGVNSLAFADIVIEVDDVVWSLYISVKDFVLTTHIGR